ncbi:MAG: hypothetical protein H8E46_05290 [FCB group bacterium]|nr:hypothetical protein [FCB group bacterium]
MPEDQKGQKYREIKLSDGCVRITLLKTWNEEPGFRIQIKEPNGHLRPGPEMPFKQWGEVVSMSFDLIADQK